MSQGSAAPPAHKPYRPDTSTELACYRHHLEAYRGVTLQALDCVPADKLGWRPAQGLLSISEQFDHVAATEELYIQGLRTGRWRDTLEFEFGVVKTREALRQRLDHCRAVTLDYLAGLSAEGLSEEVQFGNSPLFFARRSVLLQLIAHEVHHKAQVSHYLYQHGIQAPFFAIALPPGMRPDNATLPPGYSAKPATPHG